MTRCEDHFARTYQDPHCTAPADHIVTLTDSKDHTMTSVTRRLCATHAAMWSAMWSLETGEPA